jgi:peptide/nickel transport system permease protein
MRAYIVRRLGLIIPTLFLVTLIVFFSIRLIPGSTIDLMVMAHQSDYTVEDISREEIEHRLGLDIPIHVQYGRWISGVIMRGDLGKSLWSERPVIEGILHRLPISFELGLIALVTGLLISLPVGIYSAIRQDTIGDYLARSVAIICIAVPGFWLGTMIMVFPSIWWGWSPPMQCVPFFENPMKNLAMFIIPGVILGMVMSGTTMRMTRTMMLEVMRQDYIRTAWSKGLKERLVIVRHALKNALIPVVTIVGMQLPVLIGGSVVLERIFCLPGIGWLMIDAISARDYPMLSAINLIIASAVLVINLAVDLTYAYLDPRVHYR